MFLIKNLFALIALKKIYFQIYNKNINNNHNKNLNNISN